MADKSGIPGRRNKGGKRLAPPQRRHGLDIGGKAERGSHKRLAQPQPKQERRESHKRLAQPQREHKESAWKKTFSEWKKAVSAWGARVKHTCRECREKAGKAVGAWRERLKRSPQAERRYNPWVWLATLFLGPLAILLCVQTITFASLFKAFSWVFGHLGAAVLCYLALLSAMIIILALIWKIWSAFLILAIPAVALAVVNRMKLSLNGTPLLLSDFSLASKAGDVAGFVSPQFKIGVGVWAGLILAVLGIIAAGKIGWRPKELTPRWSLRKKVIGVVAVFLAAVMFLPAPFYLGANGESQEERNQRLGLLGGMYSAILNRAFRKDNVNQAELDRLKEELLQTPAPTPTPTAEPVPTETPEPVTPNVILMMSESFCDPTEILPEVEFASDPIPYYRSLAAKWPSGEFYSNTYAGGTGSVEMEVFTGIPMAFLREGEDLTNLRGTEGVYDRLPSIVKSFKAAGYSTQFIHNYTTRLYNRVENFPAIGFDQMTFEDGFPEEAEWDGPYLKDMELTYAMIRAFEEKEEDEPLFLYGLTMENHQPYYSGKFPEPSGLEPQSEKLDEGVLGTVDALVYGIHAADRALGALVEYFETVEEPVLLIFWGDHLPGLYVDDNNTIYSQLGYVPTVNTLEWDAETMKKMHTTPFLVWNNYGAQLEVPDTTGPSQLGSSILGWAGLPKTRYFQWVDQSLDTMQLYRTRLYIDDEGVPYKQPPERDKAVVERYRSLVYDIIYGDGQLAEEMTKIE